MLRLLHQSLFWCSDLPQRVQWGFPTKPGAASFTVDRLSDLTAVSRLLHCGLLEGLPLTCPSKMGDCLMPSRSCALCSAIASFWGAIVFAFSSVKLASDCMRSDSAVLGIPLVASFDKGVEGGDELLRPFENYVSSGPGRKASNLTITAWNFSVRVRDTCIVPIQIFFSHTVE